jgi:hydrogenase maturation protein HypF
VEIVVQGQTSNIENFIHSIKSEAPALAQIDDLVVYDDLSNVEYSSFEIQPSTSCDGAYHPIPADIAICPECERELFDPRNRRYLYPFINCANCGPRFTIIKDIPYDRQNTTMVEFGMCERCEQEFKDSQDRHFRAQPIACPECGPFVALRDVHTPLLGSASKVSSMEFRTSAILKARRLLREGYILGIKGLGGFHLACDASNSLSVEELRDRKGRIEKPFALMAANMEVVRSICHVSPEEEALLTSREKPIVLLEKKTQNGTVQTVSKWVAPNLDTIGVMLPYTPLHHLLLNQKDLVLEAEPAPSLLVMTSGNFSEEPISTDDEDALVHLSPLVDAFILHNRDIHMRCDDSVVRVAHRRLSVNEHSDGKNQPSSTIYLRRSRGYSPYPVKLPFAIKPTLAVGGEIKNTFCLARDQYAFLSHHIGDMESPGALESFEQGVEHLSHIFRVQPDIIAHDLHPDYASTRYAQHLRVPLTGVQHHHAHIVSCMVDNGLDDRRVIGLAFDGAGYGTDGMIWGGEVLLASFADFKRFAHLEYLPLPGRDPANRIPWSIAAGYAHALDIAIDDLHFLKNIDKQAVSNIRAQVDRSAHPQLTSSIGYLFDAVASLVGVQNDITYEAQAAMELEVLARPFVSIAQSYPYVIDNDGTIRLKGLLSSLVADIRAQKSIEVIAACFHKTVADMAIDSCVRARRSTSINEVALSGGVWQNQILLSTVKDGLEQAGFVVYFHQQVPTNDGGLALGQAVIAYCSQGTQEYSPAVMGGAPSDTII